MKIAVTGANGYIGSRLVAYAAAHGHTVTHLTRRRPSETGAEWTAYDLAQSVPPNLPADTSAVVHLAANTRVAHQITPQIEIDAAAALLNATSALKARFIFVSSQTAQAGAPTPYGRTKHSIEQLVLEGGGIVIRPGMVYGGPSLGLNATLSRLVKKLPILPAFLPAPKVQPVHVDDLAAAIIAAIQSPISTGRAFNVASPRPISFHAFLGAIARHQIHQPRLFLPFPAPLITWLGAMLPEKYAHVGGLSQLQSLFALKSMQTTNDIHALGVTIRPLAVGMAKGGARTLIIREGMVLLRYVLRAHPSQSLLKRYVHAVANVTDGKPLDLSPLLHRFPGWLGLLESPGSKHQSDLSERLNIATRIAEASPEGSHRFLATDHKGPIRALISLACIAMGEVIRRLGRLALAPLPGKSESEHRQ